MAFCQGSLTTQLFRHQLSGASPAAQPVRLQEAGPACPQSRERTTTVAWPGAAHMPLCPVPRRDSRVKQTSVYHCKAIVKTGHCRPQAPFLRFPSCRRRQHLPRESCPYLHAQRFTLAGHRVPCGTVRAQYPSYIVPPEREIHPSAPLTAVRPQPLYCCNPRPHGLTLRLACILYYNHSILSPLYLFIISAHP